MDDNDSIRATGAYVVVDQEPDDGDDTIDDERLGTRRPSVPFELGPSDRDSAPLVLGAGSIVDGYAIDHEIGRGGMGVVYAATHPVIGKRAAIKVLKPEVSGQPRAIERFMLEARAVNAIGHRNIVDIFDFGRLEDGREYLMMDLLDGETLRARLRHGPLSVSEAASVIDECASALDAAHANGIIHRDLKPDNVFLVTMAGRWPEVKILDFGLVKLVAGSAHEGPKTKTGSIVGTPNYMSPEQARGRDVDPRTDIYGLGVTSFELLTGELPYVRGNQLDTLIAHAEAPVPSLLARVDVPVELAQLVEAMLAKRPDERPTLAAIRAVLRRLRKGPLPTATPTSKPAQASAPSQSMRTAMTVTDRPGNLSRPGDEPTSVSSRSTPRRPSPTAMRTTPFPAIAPMPHAPPPPLVPPPPRVQPPPAPVLAARVRPDRRWLYLALVVLLATGGGVIAALAR